MSIHDKFFRIMRSQPFRYSYGQRHNRTDQELHYIIVHLKSGQMYDYNGHSYDDDGMKKAVEWMERQLAPENSVLNLATISADVINVNQATKLFVTYQGSASLYVEIAGIDPLPVSGIYVDVNGDVRLVVNKRHVDLRDERDKPME